MRAVTLLHGAMSLTEVPEPQPGPEHVVVDVHSAGICGSDLHTQHAGDELADTLDDLGYPNYVRSHREAVLGHEIAGHVSTRGRGTSGPAPGTPVVVLPLVRHHGSVHPTGLSDLAPGGFAEQVLAQAVFALPVPNGLPLESAVLTEPLAVAWHTVNRSAVRRRDTAVVLGCGPVGLGVVAVLKARGVRTVVASDPSVSRRAAAERLGADIVVDPQSADPFGQGPGGTYLRAVGEQFDLATHAVEQMHRVPLPWWATWRLLEGLGRTDPAAPVVFECVGVPGFLDRVVTDAPLYSRIVVAGLCSGRDTWRPSVAVSKEIDLRFVMGYTPLEFRDTLMAIADGTLDVTPFVTGRIGLAELPGHLQDPLEMTRHVKVLVQPGRS